MRSSHKYPSFWSGIAANKYCFEDTIDYSLWACSLLEKGYDSDNICILAGLDNEQHLFDLLHWHHKVLRDLGCHNLNDKAQLQAHVRGYIEEFLDGQKDYIDVIRHFHELFSDTDYEVLKVFSILHYGYWDFDICDVSEFGIYKLEDFPDACRRVCLNLLKTVSAEQDAAPKRASVTRAI